MNNGTKLRRASHRFFRRRQKGRFWSESFSNTVISRASYYFDQFVYGAKFLPMFHPNENNTSTILHLDRLDDYAEAELPIKMN